MNKASKTNTLCWYPFNQVAGMSWAKGIGPVTILPCCHMVHPDDQDPMKNSKYLCEAKGNFTPDEIFNSESFKELRQSMIKGEKHPACNICWNEEKISDFSPRLTNANANDEIDINAPSIKALDMKMSEHCNLQCRMCNPNSSNKLRIDQQYFHNNKMTYMTNENKTWGWEVIDKPNTNPNEILQFEENTLFYKSLIKQKNLIKIRASGGEPMMSDSWKKWVDEIITDKDYAAQMTIKFHTNATKFTDENIERLLHFKEIQAILSIDATSKCYEYVRYPMTWQALNNSLKKFIKIMPTEKLQSLHVTSVFSIYSAFDVENFVIWAIDLFKQSNSKFLSVWFENVTPLSGNLAVKRLPNELIVELIAILERANNLIENTPNVSSNISGIILHLKSYLTTEKPLKNQLEMKREVVAFDMARNQSYSNHLDTKLVEWLDTLNHQILV